MWPDAGLKRSPIFSKLTQKEATVVFTWKVIIFKTGKKVAKCLCFICKKICCQILSKMGARPGHTGSLAGILSAAQNLSILEPRNGLELFPAKPSRNNLAQNSSPLLIAYLKCTQVRHRAKGLFTYLHLSHISRYIIVTRMMLKLK